MVRAPPRVLPRSLAPSGVLWGGRSGPGSHLPGCCCEGRLRSGAPPPPTARPLGGLLGSATHVLWARVCGCGGPTLSPWPACPVGAACLGGGVVGGRPRGGVACHCCEGRLVSGALPPPTARPLGGLPGPPTHWLWVRGGAGVATHNQPHRVRSCQLALRAVGAARGRPGGGASCLGVGRPGSGALLPPSARPLGGLPGPTTHWLWVRGGAGVGTRDQPHSARLCVLSGRHEVAWGGRLLPGCGASGVGRSPTPDCPPSGRAGGAHSPLAVGVGGCARGDPSPTPQRALLRAGSARCGGGTRAPGGAPPAWVWGVLGRALSQPRLPALWAGCRGPLPTGCGYGGVWAWGPVTNPTARALASWLCALWGRHEGARGGRLLPGCGASGVRRSPTPDCPPSGRAAGAHYPLAVGAGVGGVGTRHQPHSARSCELALPRCGGSIRVPGEGASCLGVGPPMPGALPPPTARPLGGLPGPTTHWLWVWGGCGCGDPSPTPQRALLRAGFARCGGGTRAPGGGASCLVVRRPGSGASNPRMPALWAGCRGPLPTGCGCGGLRAWGPVTNPTARALVSWLCALWGRHEGAPAGAPLAWVWGLRCRELSHPRLPALWAGCRGPLPTGCGCGGPRAWGPVTNPTARALACWLCALCGQHEGARGGASCLNVGRLGSGALPSRTARPLGAPPGPTTHWLWVRGGAGVGTRHQPHSARSFELALRAVGAARGRPGGGRLLPGCGVSGVGRFPTPDCPPSGRAAVAHYPLAVGMGGCGRADPSPTPQRAVLRAGFARCGGGMRVPGGGASCLGVGRPGSGALAPPTVRPLGGLPGPTTHWLLVRGLGAWGPGTSPTARALASWLCPAVGAASGCPGRAPLAWVWGLRCRALSHPRLPALWAGCRGPLPTGCGCGGGAGVGTRHQPHSARSCELALRAVGAARGRPGGAPPAWVCGVRGRALPIPECPPSERAAAAHYPLAVGAGGCGRGDPSPTPQRALL